MRSNVRKMLDDFTFKVESSYRKYSYSKQAKQRLKRMNGGYDLGKEYQEIVVPYWKQFGIKPKKFWYKIFADRDQKVDPRYIPDDLWYGEIVPYYSNSQFRRLGEDKCLHDLNFPDLNRPKTIAKNIACVYYDADMNIITKEDVLNVVASYHDDFIIKPSIDSGEARLIKFFEAGQCSREEILVTIDTLKANYIIQEVVKQHATLSRLNETSLNTIRTISFFFKNEIHILSSVLRIGAENSRVDNIGAGGYAVPIYRDGSLHEKGVNRKAEWVDNNSRGIYFKDIVIPKYDELIEIIKREHRKKSHFKIIGWDFAIDQDGDVVFIEFNSVPGPNQMTLGPTFGDLTEQVLQDVFVDKTLKYAQN